MCNGDRLGKPLHCVMPPLGLQHGDVRVGYSDPRLSGRSSLRDRARRLLIGLSKLWATFPPAATLPGMPTPPVMDMFKLYG